MRLKLRSTTESSANRRSFKITATEGVGVNEFADHLVGIRESGGVMRNSPERLREEARALLRAKFEATVEKELGKVKDLKSLRALLK